MVEDSVATPEFSRPIPVDQIGSGESARDIEASPAERAAVASRLGLRALDRLTASLRLRRLPDGLIRLSGRFAADVVQNCVVTLEPVAGHCSEALAMRFGQVDPATIEAEIEVESLAEDDPEPIVGGCIDLGEAVVQQLAVSLDPYPRLPGASVPAALSGENEDGTAAAGAFAALAKLRKGAADGA